MAATSTNPTTAKGATTSEETKPTLPPVTATVPAAPPAAPINESVKAAILAVGAKSDDHTDQLISLAAQLRELGERVGRIEEKLASLHLR